MSFLPLNEAPENIGYVKNDVTFKMKNHCISVRIMKNYISVAFVMNQSWASYDALTMFTLILGYAQNRCILIGFEQKITFQKCLNLLKIF